MTFANVYRKAASGAGTIDRLTTDNTFDQESLDWSRDGRFLHYTQITSSSEITVLVKTGRPYRSSVSFRRPRR